MSRELLRYLTQFLHLYSERMLIPTFRVDVKMNDPVNEKTRVSGPL